MSRVTLSLRTGAVLAAAAAFLFIARAQPGVLYTWAERDPVAALDAVDTLSDPTQRNSMRAFALARLAQSDPGAAIRYFDKLDDAAQREASRNGLWQQIAATSPELVLERIGRRPGEVRLGVEGFALQTLAQRDPHAAMDRLAQTPPGPARQQLTQSIARALAEKNAEEALAWARALQPPDWSAVAVVASSVATQDPLRAFDLAAQGGSSIQQMQSAAGTLFLGRNPRVSARGNSRAARSAPPDPRSRLSRDRRSTPCR
jgi:hypothetical protein